MSLVNRETAVYFGQNTSRISWGAVLAGAVVAVATILLLSLLGAALGAGSFHAFDTASGEHARYGIGVGIWQILNVALSMALGGYVTARLSGTHSHLDGELHGLTMWGLALLLGTLLLAHAAGVVGHAVTEDAGAAVSRAVDSGYDAFSNPRALIVGRLGQLLGSSEDPTTMSCEQIYAEITTLVGRSLNGPLSDTDRGRLVALVAAHYGVTKEEAVRRINLLESELKANLAQAEQRARLVEDDLAHGAAIGARSLFASLVLGLLAALIGAWIGTRHKRALHPQHDEDVHVQRYGAHEFPAGSVSVYDDNGHPFAQYLRGVTFPIDKQELLRLARSGNSSADLLHAIERLREGSFTSVQEILTALRYR